MYSRIAALKMLEAKESIVLAHTGGRTSHVSEISEVEFHEIMRYLDSLGSKKITPNKCDIMRKKIIAIAHQMGWYAVDAAGAYLYRNNKPLIDYARIDNWCKKHTPFHKALNDLTSDELPVVITLFQKVQQHQLSK